MSDVAIPWMSYTLEYGSIRRIERSSESFFPFGARVGGTFLTGTNRAHDQVGHLAYERNVQVVVKTNQVLTSPRLWLSASVVRQVGPDF